MLNIQQNVEAVQPQSSSSITIQSEIEIGSKNGTKHKEKKKKIIANVCKKYLNLQSENEEIQLGHKKLEKTKNQIPVKNEQKQKDKDKKQNKSKPIENLNIKVDKHVDRKKAINQCSSNMEGTGKKKSSSDNYVATNTNCLPVDGKMEVIPKKKRRRRRRKKVGIQANTEMQDAIKQSKCEVAIQITEDLRNKGKISKIEIAPSENEEYNNQLKQELLQSQRKSDESKVPNDDAEKLTKVVESDKKQKNALFSCEALSLKENRKMIDSCQVEEEIKQIKSWKNDEFCFEGVNQTEENGGNYELKQTKKEGNEFTGCLEKQRNNQMIDDLVQIEENSKHSDVISWDLKKISKRNDEGYFKSELKPVEDLENKNSICFKNETMQIRRKSEWTDTCQDRNDYEDVCNVIENLLITLESGNSESKEESMQNHDKIDDDDKLQLTRARKQIKEEIGKCQLLCESREVKDKENDNYKLIQIVEKNKDKKSCQTITLEEEKEINCNQLDELKNVGEDSNGILFNTELLSLDKLEEKNGKGQLMVEMRSEEDAILGKQKCVLESDSCTLFGKSKQIEVKKPFINSNFKKEVIQNEENPDRNKDYIETIEERELIQDNEESINTLIYEKEKENELMQPHKSNSNDNLVLNELISMKEKLSKDDCQSEVELGHLKHIIDSDDSYGKIKHDDEKISTNAVCEFLNIEEQQNNIIYDLEGEIIQVKEKINDNCSPEKVMHNEAVKLFGDFIKIEEEICSDNCQSEEKIVLLKENIVENSDNYNNGEVIPVVDKEKVIDLTYEVMQNQDVESDKKKLKKEVVQNKGDSKENGNCEFLEGTMAVFENYNEYQPTCDLLQKTNKIQWNNNACPNELIGEQKGDELVFTEESEQRCYDSFKKAAMNEENEEKYETGTKNKREKLIEIEDRDYNDAITEVQKQEMNEKHNFAQKIEINNDDCDVVETFELENIEKSNNDQIVCDIIRIELIKNNCQTSNKLQQIEKEETDVAIVKEGNLSQGEMAFVQINSYSCDTVDKMLFQDKKQKEITQQSSSENHVITECLEHSKKISTSTVEKVTIKANNSDSSYLKEEIKLDSKQDDRSSLKVVGNQDEWNKFVQSNQNESINSVNNQQNKEMINTPDVMICEEVLIKQSDFADHRIEKGSMMLDQETQKIISLFSGVMEVFKEERKNIRPEKKKKALLIDAMKLITSEVSKKKCVSISYDLAELRCAYLYINLLSNIESSRKFLGWSKKIISMGLQSKLHVCSIGGGPGTEILGLWKLIQDTSWWSDKEIICHIFDIFGQWRSTYKKLKEKLDPDNKFRCTVTYETLNILKNIEHIFSKIDSADLVMVVKLISSVLTANNYNVCKQNFKKIIQRLKPNAVLFFIDDADGEYLRFMTGIAEECGLINYYCIYNYEFDLASPEYLHHLETYKEEFDGFVPKTADKLAFAVWKKKAKVTLVDVSLQSFQKSPKKIEVSQNIVTTPYVDKSKEHCIEEEKNRNAITADQNQTKKKEDIFLSPSVESLQLKEAKQLDKKISNKQEIGACENTSIEHSHFTELQIKKGTVKVETLNENTKKIISLFDIIMKVFKEETLAIHSNKAKRTSLLLNAMKSIIKNDPKNNGLPSKLPKIKYELPEFCCAYLYINLLYNIEIVKIFLEQSRSLIPMDFQSKLHVCSIGGGPGSDIFGLQMLKQEVSSWADKEITSTIFDICGRWKNVYSNLRKKLNPDNKFLRSASYRTGNFLKNSLPDIALADLVMVVNFVSSVLTTNNRALCKKMFKQMLKKMKPNAMLFFVDSAAGDYVKFMAEISAECGFSEHHYKSSNNFDIISSQHLHHLEVFKEEFDGIIPKTKDKVSFALWKKRAFSPSLAPQKTLIYQNTMSGQVNLLLQHLLAVIKEEEIIVTKEQPFDYFAVVKKALCSMGKLYSIKNFQLDNPESVNFDLSEFRSAYLYKFVTCHVHFIKEYLRKAELSIQTKMKTQNQFIICSIGGGPGSDLFGVLQFLQEAEWWKGIINAKIFDLHKWQNTFQNLRNRLDPEKKYLNRASYQCCDIFKNPEKTFSFVSSADLIMMVKLLSAVLSPHNRSECKAALVNIIAKMKADSLVFFIDNTGGGSLTLMREIAKDSNMKEIFLKKNVSFQLAEQDLIQSNSLYQRFGCIKPQHECNLSVAIWQKQPESNCLASKTDVLVTEKIQAVHDNESQYIDVGNKEKSSDPFVSWQKFTEEGQLNEAGRDDKIVSSALHVDDVDLGSSEIDRYYEDDALLTENKIITNKLQENGIYTVNSVSVDDYVNQSTFYNTLKPCLAANIPIHETNVNEKDPAFLPENLADFKYEKNFPELGKIIENTSQLEKCCSQIKINEVTTSGSPLKNSEENISVDFLKQFVEQQSNNALHSMLLNPVNDFQYTSSIMFDRVQLSHVLNQLTDRNFCNPEKFYEEISETTDKTMFDSSDFIQFQSSANKDLAEEYSITVDACKDREETISHNNLQTKELIMYNREELFEMREKLLFSCRSMCQLQNDIESYVLHSTENESTTAESIVQDNRHCYYNISIRIKDLVKGILEKNSQTVDDIEVLSWIQSLLRLLRDKRIPMVDLVPNNIIEHRNTIGELIQYLKENKPRGEVVKMKKDAETPKAKKQKKKKSSCTGSINEQTGENEDTQMKNFFQEIIGDAKLSKAEQYIAHHIHSPKTGMNVLDIQQKDIYLIQQSCYLDYYFISNTVKNSRIDVCCLFTLLNLWDSLFLQNISKSNFYHSFSITRKALDLHRYRFSWERIFTSLLFGKLYKLILF